MLRRKKRGQSTAEYAIVIALVLAAVVAMQVYVKRGIQAKVKGAVDYPPETGASGIVWKGQYEPYYSASDMTTKANSEGAINNNAGGEVVRSTKSDDNYSWGTQTTTKAE